MRKRMVATLLAACLLLSTAAAVYAGEAPEETADPPAGTQAALPEEGENAEEPAETPDETPDTAPDDTPDPEAPAPEAEAAHAVYAAPPEDGNLLENGGFELDGPGAFGLKDWTNWNAGSDKTSWTSKLDTEEKTEGTRSLYLKSESAAVRLGPSYKAPIEAGKSYITSVDIRTQDLVSASGGALFRTQPQDASGQKTLDPIPMTSYITGTTDWTTYQLGFTAPKGTVRISVEPFLDWSTGEVWFDNVRVVETYTLSVTGLPEAGIPAGESVQLGVENSHSLTDLPAPLWSSADETIATVSDAGLLTAVAEGATTITARVDDLHAVTVEVTVGEKIELEFENLLTNGSFEETEPVTDPENANTNWKLWENDTKAVGWTFQRYAYQAVAPVEDYNASFDQANVMDGGQSIKMVVENAKATSQQAILKQDKISAQPATVTDITFWAKTEGLTKDMELRLEEYDASNTMLKRTTIGKVANGTMDWTEYEITHTTQNDTVYVMLVFLFTNNSTGTVWLDDVSLAQPRIEVEGVEMKAPFPLLAVGDTVAVEAAVVPAYATDRGLEWSSANPAVATVKDGVITGVAPGKVTITAAAKANPEIKASCAIEIVESLFAISYRALALTAGEMRYMTVIDSKAEDPSGIKWTSSNETVAAFEADGLLVTTGTGTTTVTATSKDGKRSDSIEVTVAADAEPFYAEMRSRWLARVIGEDIDLGDALVKQYVDNLSTSAETLWQSLDKTGDRDRLWPKVASDSASADITTQFKNLRTLAQSFATPGSALYGERAVYEELVAALRFMVEDMNFNGTYVTGNWWDWQIGSPQPFVDILMILAEYLDGEILDEYGVIIEKYVPDPTKQLVVSTGAYITASSTNRIDLAVSVMGSGVLMHKPERIQLVPDTCSSLFVVNLFGPTKDGFYPDGSFVQHYHHAYTGSYGNELIKGVGRLMAILADTPYDFDKAQLDSFYAAVLEGFLPTMYDGKMMSNVSGRSIARYQSGGAELSSGNATIANLLTLARYAPEQYRSAIQNACKYWMNATGDYYDHYERARDLEALLNYKRVLEDDTIPGTKPFSGAKVFGQMDRVVQNNPGYTVALSMYSSRIGTFESLNKENMMGWHTGSGMLYVYNADLDQFGQAYWPTVDPYRMPGTTVDTRPIVNTSETNATGESKKSTQSWAGGVTDDTIAAAGMQYDPTNLAYGMDLTAKKSWFMMDGYIVALGADITGTSPTSIETIVENRQLGSLHDAVLLNGAVFEGAQTQKALENGSWVHMQGTSAAADMAYIFPTGGSARLEKETRTGSYVDINPSQSNNTQFTQSYLKVSLDHGQAVENGTYYYITLPGVSAAKAESFAANVPVQVLANNAEVQAIAAGNVLAFNAWGAEGAEVAGYSVNKPASVLVKQVGETLQISLGDPTHGGGSFELTLGVPVAGLVSRDAGATLDGRTLTIPAAPGGGTTQVAVSLAQPEKLLIASAPTKTTYKTGEALDLTGLAVNAVYENGETLAVGNGYEVTGFDSKTPGTQTLTVSFMGLTATFKVTVEQATDPGTSTPSEPDDGSSRPDPSQPSEPGTGGGSTPSQPGGTSTSSSSQAGGTSGGSSSSPAKDKIASTGDGQFHLYLVLVLLATVSLSALGGLVILRKHKHR